MVHTILKIWCNFLREMMKYRILQGNIGNTFLVTLFRDATKSDNLIILLDPYINN